MHVSVSGFPCPFQSTLSMRRATGSPRFDLRFGEISIHALHEESDQYDGDYADYAINFNPRSP